MRRGRRRHGLQAVGFPPQREEEPIESTTPPPVMAGIVAKKTEDVDSNPETKHTQFGYVSYTRKLKSMRCNTEDYWVHLRCASIALKHYTNPYIIYPLNIGY